MSHIQKTHASHRKIVQALSGRKRLLFMVGIFLITGEALTHGSCCISGGVKGKLTIEGSGEAEIGGEGSPGDVTVYPNAGGMVTISANTNDPDGISAKFVTCGREFNWGAGTCNNEHYFDPYNCGPGSWSCFEIGDCDPLDYSCYCIYHEGTESCCEEDLPADFSDTIQLVEHSDPSNSPENPSTPSLESAPTTPEGTPQLPTSSTQSMSLGWVPTGAEAGKPIGRLIWSADLSGLTGLSASQVGLQTNVNGVVNTTVNPDGSQHFSTGDTLVKAEDIVDGGSVVGFTVTSFGGTALDEQISKVTVRNVSIQLGASTYQGVRTTTLSADGSVSEIARYGSAIQSSGPLAGFGEWLEESNGQVTKILRSPLVLEPVSGIESRVEEVELWRSNPAAVGGYHRESHMLETYRKFPWGEELVESQDGGATAPVRRLHYYDEAQGGGITSAQSGNLWVEIHADGGWTRYDRNPTTGEVAATLRAWGTAGIDGSAGYTFAAILALTPDQCWCETVSESEAYNGDTTTTRETTVLGALTGREIRTEKSAIDPITGERVIETRTVRQGADGVVLGSSASAVKEIISVSGEGSLTTTGGAVYNVSEDGSRTTYYEEAEFVNGVHRVSRRVVHGTVNLPNGLSLRSTQDVSVSGPDGLSESRRQIYIGGGSYTDLEVTTYGREVGTNGEAIERTFQDGFEVATVNQSVDETTGVLTVMQVGEDGVETVDETDDRNGLQISTRSAFAVTDGSITHRASTAKATASMRVPRMDGATVLDGYRIESWDFDGAFDPTSTTARMLRVEEYDLQGRIVKSVNEMGAVTTWDYSVVDGKRKIVETRPGSTISSPITVTTTYSVDGRLESVVGAPVVDEYHTYGVEPATGREFERVHYGAPASARWVKQFTDAGGRLVRVERPAPPNSQGLTIQYEEHQYNSKGQRVSTTRPAMAAMRYEYDALGQLYRQGYDLNGDGVLNLNSQEPIMEYLTTHEEVGGAWWEVRRTRTYVGAAPNEFRQEETRRRLGTGPNTISESVTADGGRQVTATAVDRSTRTRTVTVSVSGNSNLGEQTYRNGFLIKSKTPDDTWTSRYYYDAFDQLYRIDEPSGRKELTFDAATGHMLTEAVRDRYNRLRTTTYTYHPASHVAAGRVDSRTTPVSRLSATPEFGTTWFEYDSAGRVTAQYGTGDYPVKYAFNAFGQMTSMTTFQVEDSDPLTPPWVDDPNVVGAVTTWVFDEASGVLAKKIDAQGTTAGVEYTYHPGTSALASRKWMRKDANAQRIVTSFGYDSAGRRTSVTYSDGTPSVSYTWRRDGSLATVTDAAGSTTHTAFSNSGVPVSRTITGNGWLSGLEWHTPMDEWGRPAGYEGFLEKSVSGVVHQVPIEQVTYEYAQRNQLSMVRRGTQTVAYNRLTTGSTYRKTILTRSDSTSSQLPLLSSMEWNAFMGLRDVQHYRTSGSSIFARSISSQANKIGTKDPDFGIHSGIPTSTRGTGHWQFVQDGRGQVTSAERYWRAGPSNPSDYVTLPPSVDYEYDELGNRIEVSYSTPYVTQATDPDVVTYTTNSLNQYTGIANPRGVVVTGFGKPPPGVVTINDVAADETDERKGMIYAKRLEAAGTGAVWLDVEVEASVDVGGQTVTAKREGHRWVPPAQETLSYDADGNLVEDGRWEYTWDGENRLIGMETTSLAATAGVPTVRLAFGYDAWGRRVMKRVWDVDGSTETLRNDVRFVYHGWNLVAEMEMKGDAEDAPVAGAGVANRPFLRRSYLWGEDLAGVVAGGADLGGDVGAGGVGSLLAVTRHERGAQGEETFWACADLNGNVIGLISAATTKLAVYEYDPFGRLMRVNEPEEGLNPIRFSSKYADGETGMSYFGFRYYTPDTGRWLNEDPIEERGGINLYGFVGNDVVNRWDSLGQSWSDRDIARILAKPFVQLGETIELELEKATKLVKRQLDQEFDRIKPSSNQKFSKKYRLRRDIVKNDLVTFWVGGEISLSGDGCYASVKGAPKASFILKSPRFLGVFQVVGGVSGAIGTSWKYRYSDCESKWEELNLNISGKIGLRGSIPGLTSLPGVKSAFVEGGGFVALKLDLLEGWSHREYDYGWYLQAQLRANLGFWDFEHVWGTSSGGFDFF